MRYTVSVKLERRYGIVVASYSRGWRVVPTLGKLKAVRESKFLTQQDLADKAGVSRVAINRLERGDVDARFSTLRKLAAALDVPPAELVG